MNHHDFLTRRDQACHSIYDCGKDTDLKAYLERQGYYNVRILKDGVVANFPMLYTVAVIIGANSYGYERRICYPRDSGLAEKMCLSMSSVDDPPIPGYTALK